MSAATEWAIIGADDGGVTVELTGDRDALIDHAASWAQQEADLWPEMGLIYMLITPEELPAARALEGAAS